MCGINGFNFKDENLILKMNQVIRHRGPDAAGIFLDENISLGHNRLKIIDLSEFANQPMTSFDEKQVIVFNGEIYNFLELKKELDYPFKTNSDTEVILAAYRKYGPGCVKKFNGVFAFAIWDREKKEIFVARDHVGVKPFYYFWDGKRFIFSSEIKAILEHNIPIILDLEAFNHYLRVLYVPEPLTMFKGVKKMPPGSFAIFKDGKLEITKYWEIRRGDYLKFSKEEIAKELENRILQSVKNQLISDKPVGVYLSGGIDSNVVLSSMSRWRKNIETFSVGFDLTEQEGRDKFNQDFNLARETAKYYGANHNEVLVSSGDVLDLFEKAVWHLDEPVSNPTIVPMMKLAMLAKNKVDVVLGGDGGDELFGGYERYHLSLLASYYQKLPFLLRKIFNRNERLKKLNTPSGIERFALFMFQKDGILKRVVGDNYLNSGISKDFFKNKYFTDNSFEQFEENMMQTDRKSWLADYSLMLSDKMSMSAGLEARVPLLDKDLAEFAAKIPLKYKVNLFNTKIILKEAFKDKLPKFIFNQPKRGWFSPGAKWLRHPSIYSMAQEVLSPNYYAGTGNLFNWDELARILKNHYNKKEYNLTILWALLTFQVWARLYNIKLS